MEKLNRNFRNQELRAINKALADPNAPIGANLVTNKGEEVTLWDYRGGPYASMDWVVDDSDGRYSIKSQAVTYNDHIEILQVATLTARECEYEYDSATDQTLLTWKISKQRFCAGFRTISGTFDIWVNGNIIGEEDADVNVDGLVDAIIEKGESIASYINDGTIENISVRKGKDRVIVDVVLETGKGYGDVHHSSRSFDFEWWNGCYHEVDRFSTQNLVGKVASNIRFAVGKALKVRPTFLTINIERELD